MGQGTLSFMDTHGKTADVMVSDITGPDEMQAIRQTIDAYSNATPYSQKYSETMLAAAGDGNPSSGSFDSVEIKAEMIFRDLNESNPGKALKQLSISAPLEDMFEPATDVGYRVTNLKGGQIADIINSHAGTNWVFVRGHMVGKRLFKKI